MKINEKDEFIFLPIVNSVFDKLDYCTLSETRYVHYEFPDIIAALSSIFLFTGSKNAFILFPCSVYVNIL